MALWERSQHGHSDSAYSFGLLGSRIPRPNLSKRRTTLLLLMLQKSGEGEEKGGGNSY